MRQFSNAAACGRICEAPAASVLQSRQAGIALVVIDVGPHVGAIGKDGGKEQHAR